MSVEPVYCWGRKTLPDGREVGWLLVDRFDEPIEVCGPPRPFSMTPIGQRFAQLNQAVLDALINSDKFEAQCRKIDRRQVAHPLLRQVHERRADSILGG